jgi:DNA-binding GntR family transcriptional regulator
LAELDKALSTLKENIRANTPLGQLAATNSFFMTILAKCGNSVLTEVVISLVSRVNFLRAQALLHKGWGVLYAQEIEDILAAIRQRNPDAARAATRKHIASACAAAKQLALSPEMGGRPEPRVEAEAEVAAPKVQRRVRAAA